MENKQQVINQEVVNVNEETQIDEQQDQQEINVKEANNQLDEQQEQQNVTIEELQKELERSKLITALALNGLSEFAGLFNLETIEEKVEFLKKVKNEILIANAYIPKDVAKQDEYTQAKQQGNTKSMIKSLLGLK